MNKTAMPKLIKVRKPSKLRKLAKFLFGHAARFHSKEFEYQMKLPNNGEKIKITWFPNNRGHRNAYIGMFGTIEEMDKINGWFILNCCHAKLVVNGNFNYIKL